MENLKEIRWRQRFKNLESAYNLLEKYSDLWVYSELERAGLIQIFETTFELAWKTIKDYLEAERYNIISPRGAIKTAFQMGLIDDGELWLEALDSRNLTVHTYNEEQAELMVTRIKEEYTPLIEALYTKLKEILTSEDEK